MSNKTNVARLCDKEGIDYKLLTYETNDESLDGKSVARLLNVSEDEIFKTLVTKGASGEIYVFVIPVSGELNLKKAARASKEKSIEMLALKDLLPTTGYVKGGCSPIGMKRQFKTYFDETLILLEQVTFNAGKVGYQLQVPVEDLKRLISYEVWDLVEE